MKKLGLFMTAFIFVFASFACSGDTVYVSITPKSHDFGDVNYGDTGSNEFILTNKYKEDIVISTIEITDANASQFNVAEGGTPATTVTGNKGTHTIKVIFMPESGKAEATMIINYNDPKDNPKTIKIKLKGNCIPAPLFEITPTTFDYGIVNLGDYVDQTFTVTNNGIADLNITDAQVGTADFKIDSGWTGAAVVVTPSSSHDFVVRFEPTTTGQLPDKLTITHDALNEISPFEVALSAEGADPKFVTNVAGTPPEIDMGGIFKDVTGSTSKFEISNTGTGDLIISDMQFSSTDFTLTSGWSGTPLTIAAGNMIEFEVTFTPGSVGIVNETLSITHNASNEVSPYDINMKGEAKDNYTPETFTKGMNALSGGTPISLYDDDYMAIPIGFTFNFYGQNYTQVYVCSNGFIGFGPTSDYDWGEDYYPLPQTTTSNNCIYLFNLDLNPEYGGTVSYKLEGSGTNRILTIEFNHIEDFFQTGYFTGQIKIYESTNIIELHYDTTMIWTTVSWSTNIIGVENQNGTKGVDWDGVNSNPANTVPNDNVRYK